MYPVAPDLLIIDGTEYEVSPDDDLRARTFLKLPQHRGHFYVEDILIRAAYTKPPVFPLSAGDRMNCIKANDGTRVRLVRSSGSSPRGRAAQAREKRAFREYLNALNLQPNKALQAIEWKIMSGIAAPLWPAFDSVIRTAVRTLAWLQISDQISDDDFGRSLMLLGRQFDEMALPSQSLHDFVRSSDLSLTRH